VYVPQQGAYREDPGIAVGEDAYREGPRVAVGEGAGREGAREDEREEDVSSFLNPFGDGMEIETVGTPDYPSGIPDMHTIHDPMISVS
jgi:hypothetical protein